MDFLWSNHRRDDLWITSRKCLRIFQLGNRIARSYLLISTRYEDPAVRALELNSVGQLRTYNHLDPVRVQRFGSKCTVYIPQPLFRKLRRSPHLDGPGVFGIHAPVSTVD